MSKRKRFCLRGHDTFVVGRHPRGQCLECRNTISRVKWNAKWLAKNPDYYFVWANTTAKGITRSERYLLRKAGRLA